MGTINGTRLGIIFAALGGLGAACAASDTEPRSDQGTGVYPQYPTGGMPAVVGTPPATGGTGGTAAPTPPPPVVTAGAGGTGDVSGLDGLAGTTVVEPPVAVPPGFPPESACLKDVTDFFSDGPFQYTQERSGSVHLYVPTVPAGCMVPVTHLANGTGGTCGTYAAVHRRFASHGFLATCYESTQTGAGSQGLEAYQTALAMYPDLASKRFGSTGHSQGGQAAFTVLQLAEQTWGAEGTYAGLAMEPASGFGAQPSGGTWQQVYAKITSPMFMFSGTSDALVSESWVMQGYDALSDTIEAYNWSAVGATHIPVPNSETMEVGVAWFRWKLLNDQAACQAFKGLAGGGSWNSVAEQNAAPCM